MPLVQEGGDGGSQVGLLEPSSSQSGSRGWEEGAEKGQEREGLGGLWASLMA